MKKFLKFSTALLGLSFVILNLYQLKSHYQNVIENKIIKKIQSRYQGFSIKGTWLQKRGDHYLGGITIVKDNTQIHHQFIANRRGAIILRK